jgi:hypothetical protein
VYARVLGEDLSRGRTSARTAITRAMREHWSLVEVAVPLVLVLALGAVGVIPDRAALVAANVLALMELAAAGGYAAINNGAGPAGALVSAAIALTLGLAIVLLKVLIH